MQPASSCLTPDAAWRLQRAASNSVFLFFFFFLVPPHRCPPTPRLGLAGPDPVWRRPESRSRPINFSAHIHKP